MSLLEKIQNDLKTFLKSHSASEAGVLRMLNAAFKNKEIELRAVGGAMAEADYEKVLRSEAKKRRDSITAFKDGGRADLAEKEEAELVLFEKYLPKQLDQNELKKIVLEVFKKEKPENFGAAMKVAMKSVAGRADGSVVGAIVKELLGS